jgi:uncharacterized membrane protein YccC
MPPTVGHQRIIGQVVQFDRSKLTIGRGLRNAVGIGVPLIAGVAAGRSDIGVTIAAGALLAGFIDLGGAYGLRWRAMISAAALIGLSTFLGAATGDNDAVAVALMALWGFGAGLAVALGPEAAFVGANTALALLIAADFNNAPQIALGQSLLIAGGALIQAALGLIAWPVEPLHPERMEIARSYRALSRRASGGRDLPVANALDTADAIFDADRDHASMESPAGDALRALRAHAHELRQTMSALYATRDSLAGAGAEAEAELVDKLLAATAPIIRHLAGAIHRREEPEIDLQRWTAVDRAKQRIDEELPRQGDLAQALAPELHRRCEALITALRHAADAGEALATSRRVTGIPLPRRPSLPSVEPGAVVRQVVRLPRSLRPPRALAILRSNLSLQSIAFRHALRLGTVLAIAVMLYRVFPLGRGYWIPLTVVFVLKPDFGNTFTRGLQRYAGTIIGVVVASLIAAAVGTSEVALVALVLVCAVGTYTFFYANYGLFTASITMLIVFLLAFTGVPEYTAATDRLIDTLIGGALALVAFVVWPTWQSSYVKPSLVRMLDTVRAYAVAVLGACVDPSRTDREAIRHARADALRARTNVEAAMEGALAEPRGRRFNPELGLGLIEHAEAIGNVSLVIKFAVEDKDRPRAHPALAPVREQLDAALRSLTAALDDEQEPPPLPPLREAVDRACQADGTTLATRAAETIVEHVEEIDRLLRAQPVTGPREPGSSPISSVVRGRLRWRETRSSRTG